MFANTERGQAQRLAYCEARKLDRLQDSLLDWHDVRAGRLTVAEKRARGREHSGHQNFLGLPACPVAGLGAT